MGVTVSMPLFGEPSRELGEGSAVAGADLRALADGLAERLRQAAEALDRLTRGGWSARVALFDLMLTHPRVATRAQAEQQLRAAGADPEQMVIVEDVEEEEE